MDSIVYAAFTSRAGGTKFQVLDFEGTLVWADKVHEVQSYLSDPEAMELVVEARAPAQGFGWWPPEEAGNVSCYHRNVPGDVVRLTGENGSIIQQYNYDAFGVGARPTSEIPPFCYFGEYFHQESGFIIYAPDTIIQVLVNLFLKIPKEIN